RPWAEGLLTLLLGTLLLFIVGDALPRSIARIAPELSEASLPLARRTLAPFGPLLWLLAWADRGLHTLVETPRPLQPDLGVAQRDMLLGVFTLADTTVDEVMTPRLDMTAVDISASTEEVLDAFRQSQHTRLPVLDGSPDNVAGVVFGKDLVPIAMGLAEPGTRWQTLVRPAAFVPETKTLDNQLRDFQGTPAHIAIVVDEFGGTSGLITREDILEEIVGEIRDEHDTETTPAIRQDGARLWVDGRTSLDDLSAALGTTIAHAEVSTVGGLVYSVLGRVPRPARFPPCWLPPRQPSSGSSRSRSACRCSSAPPTWYRASWGGTGPNRWLDMPCRSWSASGRCCRRSSHAARDRRAPRSPRC